MKTSEFLIFASLLFSIKADIRTDDPFLFLASAAFAIAAIVYVFIEARKQP